jgi:hypothetical protein
MKILTYNDEDRIPLVLYVLDLSAAYYTTIGFKFAVKEHFTDLEGKVETDFVDNDTVLLLRMISDEPVHMIGVAVSQMNCALMDIENIYNIDYVNQDADERIEQLAEDFYWEFMIDNFPLDDGTSRYDDDVEWDPNNYELNLEIYIESLVRIVSCLLELVTDGEVNVDQAYDHYLLPERWTEEYIQDQVHAYALGVLLELGHQLERHMNDFCEYYYG